MNTTTNKRRVSLIQRIGLIIITFVILTVSAAAGGWQATQRASGNVEYMRQAADHSEIISDLVYKWQVVNSEITNLTTNPPGVGEKIKLDQELSDLDHALTAVNTTISTGMTAQNAEETTKILTEMADTFLSVKTLAHEIYAYSEAYAGHETLRLIAQMVDLQNHFQDQLSRLNAVVKSDLEAHTSQVQRAQFTARLIAIATVVLALMLSLGAAVVGQRMLSRPMQALNAQLGYLAAGDYSPVEPLQRNDEIGELSRSVAMMTDRLRSSAEVMEQRITERTADLERRTFQVQVASQVARDIANSRDLESLLKNTVKLVIERFGYYYAGIFLTDDRGENEVLRAATGEAGQQMLARGHSLRIGQVGLVGNAASRGEPFVAEDVTSDATHYKNPLLPLTRSEAALPLKTSGRVIGVIDVQSQEVNAFETDTLEILQVMADQLAIAIQNVTLLKEVQDNLANVQSAYGHLEQQAWIRFFEARPILGYQYDGVEIRPLASNAAGVAAGDAPGVAAKSTVQTSSAAPVSLPLQIRGEKIGSLEVWPREAEFSEAEIYLLNTLNSRLSQIFETARLYEETQARAAREETINRLTAGIARSLDLDSVLRSAAMELGRLPAVREATVVLGTQGDNNGHRA